MMFKKKINEAGRLRVLVMRFSALGDVAMMVPVVRELLAVNPEVEVTVLSKPFAEPLFEALGSRVSFIGVDLKGRYKGIGGLSRLFKELDAMGFDCVADMHGVLRTHYLSLRFRLKGYKVAAINKRRAERKALTAAGERKRRVQLSSSFEKYREVLRALPIPGVERLTSGGERCARSGVIHYHTVDNAVEKAVNMQCSKRIGIAPFAAHKGKILPSEKMQMVIDDIVMHMPGAVIYLFGGGGAELEQMRLWKQRHEGRVMVASEVVKGLRQELQLMERLDVMVSMDSANMHLASLVGTRVVSIWGATHPFAGFLGWQQREEDCVQLPLECRPCSVFGNKPCLRGDFACMNGIDAEAVVERVMGV